MGPIRLIRVLPTLQVTWVRLRRKAPTLFIERPLNRLGARLVSRQINLPIPLITLGSPYLLGGSLGPTQVRMTLLTARLVQLTITLPSPLFLSICCCLVQTV